MDVKNVLTKLEQAQVALTRATAKRDLLIQQMKEAGFGSSKEVLQKIEELKATAEAIQQEIEDKTTEFKTKYSHLL